MVLLPDSIETAYFLNAHEKEVAKYRIEAERTTSTDKRWRWEHVSEQSVSLSAFKKADYQLLMPGTGCFERSEIPLDHTVRLFGELDNCTAPRIISIFT